VQGLLLLWVVIVVLIGSAARVDRNRKGQTNMNNKNTFRKGTAVFALSLASLGAVMGVASAQSTTTATTTAAATSATASVAKPAKGNGGFNKHADTIAKTLGITAAQLQTELSSGKTVAQVATAKGVNLQTVIDAYVAEETVEHPEMAKADVVARVTARLNGVRPAGDGVDGVRGQGGKDGSGNRGVKHNHTATATATVSA
jgi:hypothetical protein